VGKIAALHTMPVQDLLVVEAPDGKEILIPFVEQIVPEVNVAEGFVLLTPPAGLFDINTDDANTDDAGAAGPGDNA
jgi:16S rRNA processing protein RimM